jgi:hypothetical protein
LTEADTGPTISVDPRSFISRRPMLSRLIRTGGLFLITLSPLALASPALAKADRFERSDRLDRAEKYEHHESFGRRHLAPEIDPAVIGGAFALLAGGALLLKSRRGRRSKDE